MEIAMRRRVVGALVWILAVGVALGGAGASAAGRLPAAHRTADAAAAASAVVTGSYAGKLDGAQVAIAVIAEAPATDGQPRTISMYVCNGTSIAVWLTGQTTGNSATLRSADQRFVASVSVTPRRAGGALAIPDGSTHRFVVQSAVRGAGLFDVTITQAGLLQGRSANGATLAGRVAVTLPASGAVEATASAAGARVKLTALARRLAPGEYRWIVLSDGNVFGANKRSISAGGIGGLVFPRPTGKTVVRIKAGSAGQKGWNDARCQALANKWDKLVESAGNDIAQGNDASADAKLTKAQGMLNVLQGKCMTTGIG